MSILMSQQHVKNQMSIQLMSKTMEMAETNAQSMTKMLETTTAPHPDLGHSIDVKA